MWDKLQMPSRQDYQTTFVTLGKLLEGLKQLSATLYGGYKTISWEEITETETYSRESKVCKLCMEEKMEILKLMTEDPDKTINHRSELVNSCGHKAKEMLYHPDPEHDHEDTNTYNQGSADKVESQDGEKQNSHLDSQTNDTTCEDSSTVTGLEDANSQDSHNDSNRRVTENSIYQIALQIFEEEQDREGTVRFTRRIASCNT